MKEHCCAVPGGVYSSDANKLRYSSVNEPNKIVLELNPSCRIDGVRVNHSQTLAAISVGTRVEIWSLENPVKQIVSVDLDSPVLGLSWQRCARYDAGLVCLTSAKITSIYASPGDSPTVEHIEIADSTNLALDSVNFGFGSTDSPLGFLSLYLGTRDGEIFRIAPFLPVEIEITEAQYEDLQQVAAMDEWSIQFNSWSDAGREKMKVLKRSHSKTLRKIKLDPLKLIPYPNELYEEDTLDLQVGCIDWGADLVIQTTQHYVNFFVSFSGLSRELVLVSSVKFTTCESQRTIELIGSKYVVINTSHKTHLLDISPWTEEKDFESSNNKAEDNNDKKNNTSYTNVEAFHRCQCYFTRNDLVAVGYKSWPLRPPETTELCEQLQALDIAPQPFCGNTDLSSEIIRQADSVIPKFTVSGKTSIQNAADLYEFSKISDGFQSALVSLYKLMISLRYEREARKHEILAQTESLKKLQEAGKELINKQKSQQILHIRQRNAELKSRLEALRGRIDAQQTHNNIPLSSAEQSWFDELKKGLPGKLGRMEKSVTKLQTDLRNVKPASEFQDQNPKNLNSSQLVQIQRRLRDQELLIQSLLEVM